MEATGPVSLVRRRCRQEEQVDSPNLQDFLRINENENYNTARRNFSGQTLDSILRLERDRVPGRVRSNRTLLDIIRDDPFHSNNNMKSWRNWLRICLNGYGQSSDDLSQVPGLSDDPTSHPAISQRESTPLNGSSSVGLDPSPAAEIMRNVNGETAVMMEGDIRESGGEGEQPARMSLMALLEETDRQVGFDGPAAYEMETEKEEGEEKVAEKFAGEYSCCVCMVRHKGAAFIPCGHTFCRLCCRELWVQRGNCPLCNSVILEILDIF